MEHAGEKKNAQEGHMKEEGRKEEKRCCRQGNGGRYPIELPGEMLSDVSASVRRSGRARKAADGFVRLLKHPRLQVGSRVGRR